MKPLGRPLLNSFLAGACLLLVAGVGFWGVGAAYLSVRDPSPEVQSPRALAGEKHRDLGDVRVGETVTIQFELANTGSAPLVLTDLQTSCGWAPPRLERSVVAPGERTILTIPFAAPTKPGLVGYGVRVRTNDPNNPELHFTFQAHVRAPLEATPSDLYIGVVLPDQVVTHPVEVYSTDQSPFEVTEVRSSAPWIRLQRISPTSPYRHKYRLSFMGAPAGSFSESVQFLTSSAKQPMLNITVRGQMVAGSRFSPASLLLSPARPGETVQVKLTIQAVGDLAAFSPESIAVANDEWQVLSWEKSKTVPSGTQTVELRLRVPRTHGYKRTSLILRGNSPPNEHQLLLTCLVSEPPAPNEPKLGMPTR